MPEGWRGRLEKEGLRGFRIGFRRNVRPTGTKRGGAVRPRGHPLAGPRPIVVPAGFRSSDAEFSRHGAQWRPDDTRGPSRRSLPPVFHLSRASRDSAVLPPNEEDPTLPREPTDPETSTSPRRDGLSLLSGELKVGTVHIASRTGVNSPKKSQERAGRARMGLGPACRQRTREAIKRRVQGALILKNASLCTS